MPRRMRAKYATDQQKEHIQTLRQQCGLEPLPQTELDGMLYFRAMTVTAELQRQKDPHIWRPGSPSGRGRRVW